MYLLRVRHVIAPELILVPRVDLSLTRKQLLHSDLRLHLVSIFHRREEQLVAENANTLCTITKILNYQRVGIGPVDQPGTLAQVATVLSVAHARRSLGDLVHRPDPESMSLLRARARAIVQCRAQVVFNRVRVTIHQLVQFDVADCVRYMLARGQTRWDRLKQTLLLGHHYVLVPRDVAQRAIRRLRARVSHACECRGRR